MASIQARIDRLMREARKITWKPSLVILSGQDGEYTLDIREWDGVSGSIKGDEHSKKYLFLDKTEAKVFLDGMLAYWKERYMMNDADVRIFDISTLVDEERKAIYKQQGPLVLELIAEQEGKPLEVKLREVYGESVDIYALPVWGDILRWHNQGARYENEF